MAITIRKNFHTEAGIKPDAVKKIGLDIVGKTNKMAPAQEDICFLSFFGVNSAIITMVWSWIIQFSNTYQTIRNNRTTIRHLFMALYFLKNYETEPIAAALFRVTEKTYRKHAWDYC